MSIVNYMVAEMEIVVLDKNTKGIIAKKHNIAMDFVHDVREWLTKNSNNSIYLYGAGNHLRWIVLFFKKFRIPIKMILDTKKDGVYEGILIKRFKFFVESISSGKEHCWFVISAPSAAESISECIRKEFPSSKITCCDMQMYTEFIPDVEEYRKYLLKNWKVFNQLSEDLQDEHSRRVLNCILKGRITGNIQYYRNCYSPEPYYCKDIISFSPKEVMVELGGYDGETLLRFIEICPRFQAVYCFEPDRSLLPRLYEIQKEQIRAGNKVTIIDKGAWDKIDKIRFITNSISDNGTMSLSNFGESYSEVDVTTVDSVVIERISYMKMDIEGSELKALHGAENQIRENKPKLAVCVYHKPKDLIEIWKYLKNLVPEYHFFLRHHTQNAGTDTILYAIADKEF